MNPVPWLNLGPLLDPVIRARNTLFDFKAISQTKLVKPVLSLGNITMGGTGKTPLTCALLEVLQKKYKMGVVARSYLTSLDVPMPVDVNCVSLCGDEPVLLKTKFPDINIWVGPNKSETAQALMAAHPELDCLLIDDGFQHRKLFRDLDIVLLDTSVEISDYSWPLKGRLREPLTGLARAKVAILTKVENAVPETKSWIHTILPPDVLVLECSQKYQKIRQIGGRSLKLGRELDRDQKFFVFAALGNTTSFFKSVEKLEYKIGENQAFYDHYRYQTKGIQELVAKAEKWGVALTTEKDGVKLQTWPKDGPPLFVLPLGVELSGALDSFYELLDRTIRH